MSAGFLKKKTWSVCASGAVVLAFAAGTAGADGPVQKPAWVDEHLGHMRFNHQGDLRGRQSKGESKKEDPLSFRLKKPGGQSSSAGADFERYRRNESGVILGEELLQVAQPMDFAVFQQLIAQTPNADARALYAEHVKQVGEAGMSVLVLNRIIDHEAMKMKVDYSFPVGKAARYVMRSVFTQNAMMTDHVRTRSEQELDAQGKPLIGLDGKPRMKKVLLERVSTYPMVTQYEWLKRTVGENPVRFNIDWTFTEDGIGRDFDQTLRLQKRDGWPVLQFNFERLPATWQEFHDELNRQAMEKLEPHYLLMKRSAVFWTIARRMFPHLDVQTLAAMTESEFKRQYESMRDTTFKVVPMTSTFLELQLQGPKAPEFLGRLRQLLSERERDLLAQLRSAQTEEERARLRAQIGEWRKSVPRQVIEQVSQEFEVAIAKGELRLESMSRKLEHNGMDPMPQDGSVESQIKLVAFNSMMLAAKILPLSQVTGPDRVIHLIFPQELTGGQPTYLPISDSRVVDVLRNRIQNEVTAKALKQVVLRLFHENRFVPQVSLCHTSDWPCLDTNPRTLAEAMFPTGRLDTQYFNKVFLVPNDYREFRPSLR